MTATLSLNAHQTATTAIANRDGITIAVDGYQPTRGFAVARVGFEETYYMPESHSWRFSMYDACSNALTEYLSSARVRKALGDGAYLGAWWHDSTLYLDLTDVFHTCEVALAYGRARKQIAIYDLAGGYEIACDPVASEA